MAVELVSDYAIGENFNNVLDSTDNQRYGFHQSSLTEWNTTTVPKVAGGTRFENNDGLYRVTADTTVGGSPPDGKVFIYFDELELAFTFTTTVPTWSDTKQGWYGTVNTNDRYLPFMMTKSGSSYSDKRILLCNNNESSYSIEDWTDADTELFFASDASVLWDESEDEFVFSKDVSLGGNDLYSENIEVNNVLTVDTISLQTGMASINGGIQLTNGNITLTSGIVEAEQIRADGDSGGVSGRTTLTGVTASTSAGVGDVLSGNNDNAGYIKMYIGTTTVYVPYWTSIT